jgi:phage gp36-like protein
MAYVTQAEIEAEIPAQLLARALDDDGDGVTDDGVLAQIIANAARDVDGALEGRFDVPFAAPAPAVVREAAFVFTCETLFSRRRQSVEDVNPYRERADKLRTKLERIAAGELPLRAGEADTLTAGYGSVTPLSGRVPVAT